MTSKNTAPVSQAEAIQLLRDALIEARSAIGHPDNIAKIDAALTATDSQKPVEAVYFIRPGDAWVEVDKDSFDKAAEHGFGQRILYTGPVEAGGDERELFEKSFAKADLRRNVVDGYCSQRADDAWEGWRERALLSVPAAQQEAEIRSSCNYIGACGCKTPCDSALSSPSAPAAQDGQNLQDERDEDAWVIDRFSKILAGVAIALKGEEAVLHRHGYQDLVEKAQVIVLERDLLKMQVEEMQGSFFNEPSKAMTDILAERKRQISMEGWTPEHDDEHIDCDLSDAAAAYAIAASDLLSPHSNGSAGYAEMPPDTWPATWTWRPSEPRRMLVKAGALIAAEIERLDRMTTSLPAEGKQ